MIENLQQLSQRCDRLDGFTNQQQMKLNILDSRLSELYSRVETVENELPKLYAETLRLDKIKTDLTVFRQAKKKLDVKNIE